ncbi:hypothetical protein A2662_03495 [Candidatus Giovannonibacteria bacterium RIFCSPHIGHO2_01_FULL_45_33]|uniref:Uncharacterized protein n=1 Tax=Candidatus Giovannonibacteria bacterium RIFCSPLOWO2_01_FULL_45_34 TaxID=1798351 RepID=A0A1F5X069_9BACT|nr:MAG: hypothetical protein A2662_03495 [Candidatus Giovannonibacteria bacterium RIFCSPHIGHO2_01_FULL_45_33]OGF71023.1 MAG: hypothetical protein A3C73_02635 [Candidatus Giovannonibacteria bacterium RIFCSPHIGHO2_02_FULL_44_11]OGF81298.1 MAG: hypothetical protein A2930_03465 [Candidatus Giovannonibacteria bacterium RIFCSPLOWO2_01_FULL_45_34]
MFFYFTLFLFSAVGMLVIARRNRELFYTSNFAQFMAVLQKETSNLWHAHLRERSFVFIEKSLQNLRIWFMRIENRLLKTTHLIRGIKEKNGNSDVSSKTDIM